MHPSLNLDNLRTPEYDFTAMPPQTQQQDAYNMQSDLDMFANAQFFDFDMGEMPENSPVFPDTDGFVVSETGARHFRNNDFLNGDFNDVSNFPGGFSHQAKLAPNGQANHFNGPAGMSTTVSSGSSPSSTATPYPPSTTVTTKKVSLSAVKDIKVDETEPVEEAARVAAEEDKRRRNTAASARFRVKKKQREQALEKTAKQMTDRVTELEVRVAQLEMENKILKDLITEKSGKEVDMAEVRQKVIEATPEAVSPRSSVTSSSSKAPVKVEAR